MRGASRGSRAPKPIRAPASRRATSPVHETCLSPRSTARMARSGPTDELRRLFADAGIDPARAVRRDAAAPASRPTVSSSPHTCSATTRCGSTTEAGANGALIPQLRKRSGRPDRKSAEDDCGDLAKLAADLFDQLAARFRMRFAAFLPLVEQSLDAGRSRADQPRRAVIEPAPLRFARRVPGGSDDCIVVDVGRRSTAEGGSPAVAHGARSPAATPLRHRSRTWAPAPDLGTSAALPGANRSDTNKE